MKNVEGSIYSETYIDKWQDTTKIYKTLKTEKRGEIRVLKKTEVNRFWSLNWKGYLTEICIGLVYYKSNTSWWECQRQMTNHDVLKSPKLPKHKHDLNRFLLYQRGVQRISCV